MTPDVEFETRTYTDLMRRLERDALGFSFVVQRMGDAKVDENFVTTDKILQDFYNFLDEKKFEYKKEDLTEENVDYIRTMIAREAVSSKLGRKPMYRVLLNADPDFQEVLSLLKNSATLADLFRYAEEQQSIKKASAE